MEYVYYTLSTLAVKQHSSNTTTTEKKYFINIYNAPIHNLVQFNTMGLFCYNLTLSGMIMLDRCCCKTLYNICESVCWFHNADRHCHRLTFQLHFLEMNGNLICNYHVMATLTSSCLTTMLWTVFSSHLLRTSIIKKKKNRSEASNDIPGSRVTHVTQTLRWGQCADAVGVV